MKYQNMAQSATRARTFHYNKPCNTEFLRLPPLASERSVCQGRIIHSRDSHLELPHISFMIACGLIKEGNTDGNVVEGEGKLK